jgi:hypothetical protein
MAITKVTRTLLSTGIVDNSNATAITIDSSENVGIGTGSPQVLNHISSGYSAPTGGIDSNIFSLISNSASTGSYVGLGLLAGNAAASFIHFGDTDDMNSGTLDYFHTDNSMRFSTNGGERMRIDSSGNVGIGATPKAYHSDYKAIDINNSASVMGYTGNNGAWLMENLYYGTDNNWKHKNSDFSALVGMYDGVFNFYNTASGTAGATATLQNRLKIDQSGNVGIGTTSLGTEATLHIGKPSSASNAEGGQLVLQSSTDGSLAPHFDAYTNASVDFLRVLKGTDTASSALHSIFDLTNNRLGIGTNSPTRDFHVNNASDHSIVAITSSTSSLAGIVFGDTADDDSSAIIHSNNNNYLYFNTLSTERMRIASNGRVSIGTTTANAGLTVSNGDIRCTAAAVANDANSISMSQESAGGFITARGPNTSTRATINLGVNVSNGGSGRVGLKIDNDGSVDMAYMPSGSASSDVNINLSTNKLFYVSSSQRYKTNITDLSTSTADILSLRPVNYDRVSEELTGEVGLIAEEVYEIIPHLVNLADVDGFDTPQPESVKYSQLSVYLLKAIQEQQTIIDNLKTRIETLENV